MVNSFSHKVEVQGRETVETVQQLRDALESMTDSNQHLAESYVVELLCETLSDHSQAYSVRIRLAERA